MHRLVTIQSLLIIALCAAGLVACKDNVAVPTLMPTLPAAPQATPVRPAASRIVPTHPPAAPADAPTQRLVTTPVTATQIIGDAAVNPIPDISGADIDQALEQFQQGLDATDMADRMSDSLEVSADQALNQLGQSLDSADTLSDVIK